MKLKNSGKRIEIQTPWETQPRIYYNDELVELPYERWKLTVDRDVVYHLQQLTHDPRKPRPEGWETRQFKKTPPPLQLSFVNHGHGDDMLFRMIRKAIFNR
jgi:hypothetical protein